MSGFGSIIRSSGLSLTRRAFPVSSCFSSTGFSSSAYSSFHAIQFRSFAVKVGQRRFTKDHEFVHLTGSNTATVGITDFAQKELGDVVYVELPELNSSFKKGDSFGSVESVKAASQIYAPVDLTVKEVNNKLKDDYGLINRAAETDGWMIKVTLGDVSQLDSLLDETQYKKHTESSKH